MEIEVEQAKSSGVANFSCWLLLHASVSMEIDAKSAKNKVTYFKYQSFKGLSLFNLSQEDSLWGQAASNEVKSFNGFFNCQLLVETEFKGQLLIFRNIL